MSRSDDLLEAAQRDASRSEDYDPNDMVVDVVLVAVFRNFETGEEGIYVSTSAPDDRQFPRYKYTGMLSEALECQPGDE